MLTSNFNIPFFFDSTSVNKYKVFGQILYIYFDPTFRRYVSVIDVGLKQKATIFTDDLFFYRKNFTDNNFRFYFSQKKDNFSLKPVHFLNSKNERALKKSYLFFEKSKFNKFSFLNLNKFSFLAVKYLTAKNENLFKFKNENLLNFVLLKSISLNRLIKSYKFYALTLLNFYKNLKGSKHKIYKILSFVILLKSISLNLLSIYQSFLFFYCFQNANYLSKYFFWLNSFKNKLIEVFIYQSSDLKLKKLFGSFNEPNNFFNFKSEDNILRFLSDQPQKYSIKNIKSLQKNKNKKFNKSVLNSYNKFYFRSLNENSNLFSFSNFIFEKLNKLEFSFNDGFNNYNTTRFNFLNSCFDIQPFVNKKLRTRNYFSILSRGRPYALVNKFSFLNTFSYGFFLRRRVFKNWLKFLMYFEKLNYLLILNNEEISFDTRFSKMFFYSLIFPLIFNFRNLFFNFIKVFRILKVFPNKTIFKTLVYNKMSNNYRKFNTKFFGVLLNFLIFNIKKFNKTPKNLVLNFLTTQQKLKFRGSDFLTLNNSNLVKHNFLNIFSLLLDNLNYVFAGLKFNEKFVNSSLIKLLFTNFSLNFNTFFYQKNQLEIFKSIDSSKTYLNSAWLPVFKIFKSSRIISKYAKKYRRRPSFSKRRKFKSNFKKRGNFLASSGCFFKPQKLSLYPFKSRFFNSNKWSSSIKVSRISPTMSRYGAYLNRLRSLLKKFKSKTRLFSFKVFKNRLNLNFDLFKNISSKNIHYQRLLLNSLPKTSRIKRSLRLLKFDRIIRNWDKNQFYPNFVSDYKNFKGKSTRSNFKNKKFTSYSYNNRKNTSNFKFFDKFTGSKKPIYRERFQKRFTK